MYTKPSFVYLSNNNDTYVYLFPLLKGNNTEEGTDHNPWWCN